MNPRAGYTVTELMVAMAISLIVLLGVTTGMVTIMRSDMRQTLEMERLADGHRVAALLRSTSRLTSLSEMHLYPLDGGSHLSVSYPLPLAPDAQGHVELDTTGRVLWGEQVIFHAWPAEAPSELRMTRFRPRDNTLSNAQRQQQLEQVTLDGNGTQAANGANSSTRTLAHISPTFNLRSDGRTYDFYAAENRRDPQVNLGGVLLQPGANTITIRATDRSPASTGFGFKIDQFRISPSGLPIEAEALLPPALQMGTMAVAAEQAAGSWSDRRALSFPATAKDHELTLTFHNDTWHETLFNAPGSAFEGTVTRMGTEEGMVGTYLQSSGRELAWAALFQANTGGAGATANMVASSAVRVFIRGGQAVGGPHLLTDGDGCTVVFRASDHPSAELHILHAFISEASDHDAPGPDINQASVERLHFGLPDNPQNSVVIGSGESVRSLPVAFPIDSEKSYAISYLVAHTFGSTPTGMPWVWPVADGQRIDTYTLPYIVGIGGGIARTGGWSNRPFLQSFPGIVGVEEIRTTHRDEALYTSRIVDTRLSSPNYQNLAWTGITPDDSQIEMRVRTGNEPDLSDAPEWDHITPQATPGTVAAGNGRYVQVRATLLRDIVSDEAPELEHFTLRWLGEPANVDFGGVFLRHPAGGVAEFLVNDEAPASSFTAELELNLRNPKIVPEGWRIRVQTTPRN